MRVIDLPSYYHQLQQTECPSALRMTGWTNGERTEDVDIQLHDGIIWVLDHKGEGWYPLVDRITLGNERT